MPEVIVRDAGHADASPIADVAAVAVPHMVRSSARVAADISEDTRLGRLRWVGELDGQVVGTATARAVVEPRGERYVFLSVAVRPERGSQGVGTALLRTAAGAFPGTTRLQAVGNGDPISLAFAVRNGFLPESEQTISLVDPSTVPTAGSEPPGLREVTLEALPDMRMLLETHNLAADDTGGRLTSQGRRGRITMYQLRTEWWDLPDNAPDLSFGLLADSTSGPLLAAFTSVQVDREHGRAWSRVTATHPAFRGRGLATWVKRRTLVALARRGVREAWSPTFPDNPDMVAVNASLGYLPGATSIGLGRRVAVR